MLGLLLPLAAPAQVRHAAGFDHGLFSACEGGSYPKGLLIDLNKEQLGPFAADISYESNIPFALRYLVDQ